MTVKILIKRRIPEDKRSELLPLLIQLRRRATAQSGYVSGETLQNYEDHDEWLVISTWRSIDNWMSWRDSTERKELQEKIDNLLPEKTKFNIYQWG